jgi:integrase
MRYGLAIIGSGRAASAAAMSRTSPGRVAGDEHSYPTAALKAGLHLKIVSARLGHASETFTASVYQHALPGTDREAAGTIAALFLGDLPDETVVSESRQQG